MKNLSILKKMLVLALSAAMLLTVLTGCGSSETAAPQDEQQLRVILKIAVNCRFHALFLDAAAICL